MTDDRDKSDKTSWTGKAALAGAAIGSAALLGALLYASRRKERADKESSDTVYMPPQPDETPETD